MKPFYKSKKFWTAVVTAAALVAGYALGDERGKEVAQLLTAVGTVLIAGFGLADLGKERAAIESSDLPD